jgi:hypothetical protein
MGLLDDAIREHLELKRRRGADPGEVAREQREALDQPTREPDALAAEYSPIEADVPHEAPETGVIAGGVAEDMPDDLAAADRGAAGTLGGGETEELDMRSVLGDEHPPGAEQAGAGPRHAEDDSLEWEMPSEASNDPLLEAHEPDEDVLEETPDFLRDTPEQERLWFEQRPPRDFDFDK